MSEPTKYMASSDCMFLESPEFEYWYMAKPDELFVKESDYARLKAENERLRKAGDELHAFLINYIVESRISSAYLNKLDDGCTAANKEGKQS
jgi:hypothetical protein